MINAQPYLVLHEVWVLQVVNIDIRAQSLLPDHNANLSTGQIVEHVSNTCVWSTHLVTQIKEALVLWVVCATNKVDVQLKKQVHISLNLVISHKSMSDPINHSFQ